MRSFAAGGPGAGSTNPLTAGRGMGFGNPSLMASLRDSGHPGVVIR